MERTTHAYDGPVAVFLIGVRIHQPWRLSLVAMLARAMTSMVAELDANRRAAERGEEPWLGLLHARQTGGLAGPTSIQYWRSTQDIYDYANATNLLHRPAWVDFYRRAAATPRAVTIWHETFEVTHAESVYGGPGPFGLAKVAGVVPVGRRGESARQRLTGGSA